MYKDYFFFQAEDGIRDIGVTGVQTCALPISIFLIADGFIAVEAKDGQQVKNIGSDIIKLAKALGVSEKLLGRGSSINERSEERRVGKECRSRWSPYH